MKKRGTRSGQVGIVLNEPAGSPEEKAGRGGAMSLSWGRAF